MRVCPICGCEYSEHPALSRVDNKTEICPVCGVKEALMIFEVSQKDETFEREIDLEGFVVVEHKDGTTTLEIDIK